MNLPGLHVSAPALTEKDREDAEHAAAAGVDYLGLSFVRRAEGLGELRALVPPEVKLVGKIEKTTARAEERRVGEEGRFRWGPDHLKKKKKKSMVDGEF